MTEQRWSELARTAFNQFIRDDQESAFSTVQTLWGEFGPSGLILTMCVWVEAAAASAGMTLPINDSEVVVPAVTALTDGQPNQDAVLAMQWVAAVLNGDTSNQEALQEVSEMRPLFVGHVLLWSTRVALGHPSASLRRRGHQRKEQTSEKQRTQGRRGVRRQ